jgi:hypothetical protein
MNQHQDQEQPAAGGDPHAEAQRHHSEHNLAELGSDLVCRQGHFLAQELLRIMHEAGDELPQGRF